MANAMPAVIEAKQSQTPLILISADRPPELQESGANQTIDQVKMFGDAVLDYIGLPCPSEKTQPELLLNRIDHAFNIATGYPKGPVHINAPFRKPLDPSSKPLRSPWMENDGPWLKTQSFTVGLDKKKQSNHRQFCL